MLAAALHCGRHAVFARDCNANGTPDAADVESGFSEDCNGNHLPDECEFALLEFGSSVDLPVGRIPRVAVAADFDGDGLTDLATANQDSDIHSTSSVSVLFSRGDGTFEPAVHFGAGESLSSMAAGDLDGDGDLDLATANWRWVLVLENEGEGRFRSPVEVAVPAGTRFVTTGDVTGDGALDLVAVSTRVDVVSVLENRGGGTFGTPVSYGVGRHPTSVALADLDRDGDLDLAASGGSSGAISILLNRSDGGFDAAVSYDAGGEEPFSVLAVDLDGDDDFDLAVAALRSVSVLFNDGSGAFGAPVSHPASPSSFVSSDLDSDGDSDLAFGSARDDAIWALVNDGTGRFGGMSFWVSGVRWAGTAADLDGDGDPDLAVSIVNPDRMKVLWNEDDGALSLFRPPNTFAAGGEPHAATLGDLEGDGDLDVVTGNNNEGISVLLNNADGTFAAPRRMLSGGNSFSITAADLDSDGDPDLLSGDSRSKRIDILINQSDGTFERSQSYEIGGAPFHVAASDLDGDGFSDLISSDRSSDRVSLLFNAGDGTFGRQTDISVEGSPVATAPADLDGDRDIDLVVANGSSSGVSVLLNRGAGGFAEPVVYPGPGSSSFLAAADLDLDGHVDVAAAGEAGRQVSFFWNTGDGTFEPAVSSPIGERPYSLTIADLNGDGWPDIVTANQVSDSLSVLIQRGDRSFSSPAAYPVGSQPRFALAGDFDGDGLLDLVSANHGSRDIAVLLNQRLQTLGPAGDYLETICTALDFESVSVPSRAGGSARRTSKYVLPARADPELLPALFQNTKRHPLHEEFFRTVFPERFPGLTTEEYNRLVGRRDSRDYYVGTLRRVREDGGFRYVFTAVADTGVHPGEVLRLEEVRWIYETLSAAFQIGSLYYHPDTELARREVGERWPEPFPIPVYFAAGEPDVEYEAYSLGTGYGRVRVLTLEELEVSRQSGGFTFEDILVLDRTPRDVEGVVGGLITGERQGELSHTAIRLARRGTPDAYVANALEAFARHEGELVRLEVCEGGYSVETVTHQEAEEFWTRNRPRIPRLPRVDTEYRALDHLLDLDFAPVGGVSPEARFGGKASNFARLQKILTGNLEKYHEPGFAIPMFYYLDFMRANSIAVGGRELSYEEYLRELFASRAFQSDSRLRFEALGTFRMFARQNGVVNPELVRRLTQRIPEVFGSSTLMVRFRSSSNVEDALEFNGAGLYESTSACAADTLDSRALEGSRCDPTRIGERTIERALKKVWTSLWTHRALEERAYFQIPQESAAMGVLVTRAFLGEAANGVAFNGNPRNAQDRRFVVAAQRGEESVVSPKPGVAVELDLLDVVNGQVVEVFRERASSLVAPGETVLSDDQLRELGAFMWHAGKNLPLELEGHAREDVLLDFEFKIEPDGSLAVKQVRPFLLPVATPRVPDFQIEIPAGSTVCGVFSEERAGRDLRDEYEAKSVARLVPGTLALPADRSEFAADLFEEVRFGPSQEIAEPEGPGRFQVIRIPGACNESVYRYKYRQSFVLPQGESFEITLFGIEFTGHGEGVLEETLILDDEFLTFELSMQGALMGEPVVTYSSCSYDLLPTWEVDVELEGGSFVRIEERFLPSENNISTGPASLVHAEVEIEGAAQTVTDYWRLIYAAERHNRHVRYRVLLDPPLDVPSLGRFVRAVELREPRQAGGTDAQVVYLDDGFEVLSRPGVLSYRRRGSDQAEGRFRRGDVDADGSVSSADVLELLGVLFLRGEAPACAKAADADDDGRLTLSDPVWILLRLFGGERSLPSPSGSCGVDPTPDGLSCVSHPACE